MTEQEWKPDWPKQQPVAPLEADSQPDQEVTIPVSGRKVTLRRLSPLCAIMTNDRMAQIQGSETREDVLEYARLVISTIREILIIPRISLTPGMGEIHPNKISLKETGYILQWGMGLVAADGTDLAQTFPGQGADVSAPGADRPGVRGAAEQPGSDR